MTKWAGRKPLMGSLLGPDVVRLLVGPDQREFAIHRKLLCASSAYFRDSLAAVPRGLSRATGELPAASKSNAGSAGSGDILWLPDEAPEMFELVVLWLYQRGAFRALIDETIAAISPASPTSPRSGPVPPATETRRQALHWNLVRLHLFAAQTGQPALQDAATDGLQDLYLRCDWDVSTRFLRFLYIECAAEASFRLRKWAVAMLAWTVHAAHNGVPPTAVQHLLVESPDLDADYAAHLDKMAGSRANVRIKNPQLRIQTNSLRNEERHFGFRQCSFHSHRSAVGQGKCPHLLAQAPPLISPLVDSRREVRDKIEDGSPDPAKARMSYAPSVETVEHHGGFI